METLFNAPKDEWKLTLSEHLIREYTDQFLEILGETYGEWGRFINDIALRMRVIQALHLKQLATARAEISEVQPGEQVPVEGLTIDILGHPKIELQSGEHVTFLYTVGSRQQTIDLSSDEIANLFAEVQVFRNGTNIQVRVPALSLNYGGRIPVVADTQASLPSQLYRNPSELFPHHTPTGGLTPGPSSSLKCRRRTAD